ncbi:predicted protein [Sclerotinia sclerotiorum 1980 UF-70]|uniref:Uncharacterized protein n=1 Tax=Sclerotinia sclerotiorum (strain ATCC 18683 / 1980 / Ss-1) TaxID=665079 RepID=A7F8H3_SCLS1|nr:predicted protein [Sclerotinia sclerotiorum 1980 UF-70]EDN99044.1 predicted protein [Sclerotinia sclerotiorum 1980 UF-70]
MASDDIGGQQPVRHVVVEDAAVRGRLANSVGKEDDPVNI